MPDVSLWSLTAASNDDADADINWAEGMPASSVNDSARQIMAALAAALKYNAVANLSLSASVASNALTMAVKGYDGNDASSTNVIYVMFHEEDGTTTLRTIKDALSLTISSGSTLGHNSALKQYIYWYLIDNSGTVELAASFKYFGKHGIVTTTAEGGAGAADTGTTMYSASARTSVPFVCIGYSEDTQITAGTWAAEPSAVHLAPFDLPVISFSAHKNGTDQTGVAAGDPVKVTFGTEIYDNGSLFDASTNYRWIPPPGKVSLSGAVNFTAGEDQDGFVMYFYKNGAEFKRATIRASGTGDLSVNNRIEDECDGDDFYELYCAHSASSDRTVDGEAVKTYFMGSWSPGRS